MTNATNYYDSYLLNFTVKNYFGLIKKVSL